MLVVAVTLGQVLEQRAAERDVDQLHAPADGQHRQVARERAPQQRDLEASRSGTVPMVSACAACVAGGIDVGAAGQHQPVDQVEQLARVLRERRIGGQQQRQPAGACTAST